jgi:lipopolysaccharide transport system permease protein
MSIADADQRTAPAPEQRKEKRVTTVITPPQRWAQIDLSEIWHYRELLFFLAWRDLKVRYRQTAIGASWAVLQPVLTMVVFSIFFGTLAKIPSDGLPYPVFAYAGLLPWQLFAASLTQSSNSLVNSADLMRKVYFPRLIMPFASVIANTVDFVIAFVVLIAMMVFFQIAPTAGILLLPVFIVLALVTALGVGLWLAALNVQYRDIRYVVPFLTQFWMYLTPVIYPSSMLGEPWRTILAINPMVGVVEGFRWALLGTEPPGAIILISTLVSVVLLVSGAIYFRRVEQTFADVV